MNNFPNYNPNQFAQDNYGSNNMFNQGNSNNLNNQNNFNNTSMFNNMSNENFISMANNIDSLSVGNNLQQPTQLDIYNNSNYNYNPNETNLNGTSLNDLSGYHNSTNTEDNNTLIKSLTKEILSNIKENNIDLYDDNLSKSSKYYDDELESEETISKKKKKKKEKGVKEELKDYIKTKNPLPSTNSYLFGIFDDCFSIKDFIILFVIYFLLSQDMIKEFFSKYFTSLNPDDEGKVNIQGVIIYGLILTVLFMVSKRVANMF